jgi:shikimate dehydrogenase
MKHIIMIGSPLEHVRSPALINRILRAEDRDVSVLAHAVTEDALGSFVEQCRRDPTTIGLVVTMPLKRSICAHLAHATPVVQAINAANCVRFDGGNWIGANFDGFGFTAALERRAGRKLDGRALIIGCGGAGSAIAAGLISLTSLELLLYDVDGARAGALVADLARFAPRPRVSAIDIPVAEADIVINASPIGMKANDPLPLSIETIEKAEVIADIVTSETALKGIARRLGKTLVAGDEMVSAQASSLKNFLLSEARSEFEALAP